MEAVILAAGFGTRMGGEKPKPLLPLFGIPIVEHNIRKLLTSKINKITIVYHDERIKDYLESKFRNLNFVYNNAPERENGYSLYFARNDVKDDFILLMADHFFEDSFFSSISSEETHTAFVSSYCDDPDEATKVSVEGDLVRKIGKRLEKYDYFDTGFFYCKPDIFNYIEKLSSEKEKIKLAEVFQKIADENRLKWKSVDGFWIDIDTPEELKKAEKYISGSLSKESDGYISKKINRKFSTPISRLLVKYDFLTPNRITIISTLIGLIPFIFFAFGKFVAGGIFTQIASIIDGCDGEVARIKKLSSRKGAVLDSLLDRYVDIFIMFGIFLPFSSSITGKISFFLAVTGTILVSYISHMTGIRPKFITRDARLFLIMLGGLLTPLSKEIMLYTLLLTGILSHLGIFYTLVRFFREKSLE